MLPYILIGGHIHVSHDLSPVVWVILGLTLKTIPFCVELLRIVLQKHIILMDSHFNVFQIPDILIFKKLILSKAGLLHCHDELLAVPNNIV